MTGGVLQTNTRFATRYPDWRARLTLHLARVHALPFRPGRHDCALFAADCVRAMTGFDPARGLRGYRTLAEGHRRAQAKGFADHVAVFAALLDECQPMMARAGDVAVVEGDFGPSVGIVQGAQIYVVGRQGLGLVALTAARRAMRT